jgi:hypothetical protein
MTIANWETWEADREKTNQQQHHDRFPLMRPVQYELSRPLGSEPSEEKRGQGLTVNVGSGGVCLLMDHKPALQDVFRIHIPMPVLMAQTPTLAEVRWLKGLPFHQNGVYFVGLKFLL